MNRLIRLFGPGNWRGPSRVMPYEEFQQRGSEIRMAAMPVEEPPDPLEDDSRWMARDVKTGKYRDIRKGFPDLQRRTREDRAHWEDV